MENTLGEVRVQEMCAVNTLLNPPPKRDNQGRCNGPSSRDGNNMVEQLGQMREPESETLED